MLTHDLIGMQSDEKDMEIDESTEFTEDSIRMQSDEKTMGEINFRDDEDPAPQRMFTWHQLGLTIRQRLIYYFLYDLISFSKR